MPKAKTTIESRIVEWFRPAPIDTAEVILGIVQGVMKTRKPPAMQTRQARKTKPRQTGKAINAQAINAQPQTEIKDHV